MVTAHSSLNENDRYPKDAFYTNDYSLHNVGMFIFVLMILDKLHTIFEFEDAPVLQKNEQYNFSIRHIKPVSKDFQLIVTDGLINYKQPTPEKHQRFEKIELYCCLPDYWDLTKVNWPINWLNRIAQVPQKNKTWFGVGDTIPAGNPPQFVDERLKTDYFILSEPILLQPDFNSVFSQNSDFQLLALIPIFKKEFDFKMQNSATVLFEKFKTKNVSELIDVYREPVGRKKFMGIF